MANLAKRVPENVPGNLFVDSTCIDCDACRQIAPAVFAEAAEAAFVHKQPIRPEDRRSALHALLSCRTGSIDCLEDDDPKTVMDDFPLAVEESVFYCGSNSAKFYCGNSYFVRHSEGNWLIDSPKFIRPLVRRLENLGGKSLKDLDSRRTSRRAIKHLQNHRPTRRSSHPRTSDSTNRR